LDFPVVTQFLKQNGMSLDWFIDSLNDASLAGTANGARESKVRRGMQQACSSVTFHILSIGCGRKLAVGAAEAAPSFSSLANVFHAANRGL
jgi:hypothetical protein